jgi:hypothetical protein
VWRSADIEPFDNTDLVLLVVRFVDQLSLDIGKASGDSFMTADDLSWHGPTRNVVAWAELDI